MHEVHPSSSQTDWTHIFSLLFHELHFIGLLSELWLCGKRIYEWQKKVISNEKDIRNNTHLFVTTSRYVSLSSSSLRLKNERQFLWMNSTPRAVLAMQRCAGHKSKCRFRLWQVRSVAHSLSLSPPPCSIDVDVDFVLSRNKHFR